MQERLENVLEGPSNNLASKRPKLSYSASSLAEDKKNFLYTLMGELLQQRHKARNLSLAGSRCIGPTWSSRAALFCSGLPPGAGPGADQVSFHLRGVQQALPAPNTLYWGLLPSCSSLLRVALGRQRSCQCMPRVWPHLPALGPAGWQGQEA